MLRKWLTLFLSVLLVTALAAGAAWANPGGVPANGKDKAKAKGMRMYKDQYRVMVQNGAALKNHKFKDTKNHWASGPIDRMTALGLFAGYNDGSFRPNHNISQAEMISLLMRLVDVDEDENDVDEEEDLDDVPAWARQSVRQAVHLKIMSLNRFHSAQQASRAQTCIVFAKLLEKEGYLDLDALDLDPGHLPFADGELLIGNDDLVYILAMYKMGYIKGAPGNKFLPNHPVTRAEMAAILERILADLKEDPKDQDDTRLSDLESKLMDRYDKLDAVEVDDITLSGDKDLVTVEVEVDLEDYQDQWADLEDDDILAWLEDLVADIQDEYSRYTRVRGQIIDNQDGYVLVRFSKNGTADISVTFRDGDYRDGKVDVEDVEDELEGQVFGVGDLDFELNYVKYQRDEITVELKTSDARADQKWNRLSTGTMERDVQSICREISRAFEVRAGAEPEMVYITFFDEDLDTLESFEYDVDNKELTY